MIMIHLHSIILHAVLIQAHEDNIDSNANSDEELYEGIKDQPGHELRYLDPEVAAVENTECLTSLDQPTLDHILQLWSLIIILEEDTR